MIMENDTKTHNIGNTQIIESTPSVVDFVIVQKEKHFSEETIHSLGELGRVLGTIRKRLMRDGYTIRDGKCFKEIVKSDTIEI